MNEYDPTKYILVKQKPKPIEVEVAPTNIILDKRRNKYKCNECPLRFKDYKQLKEHQVVHENKETQVIHEEEETQDSNSSQSVTISEVASGESEDDNMDDNTLPLVYPCNFCSKVFKYDYTYAKHSKRHKLLACVKCNKVVKSKEELNHHLEMEHNYCPCQLCPQLFYSQTNLAMHMRSKHPKKGHTCSTCGIKYNTSDELKDHLKIHEQVTCDLCDAKFKNEKALEKHQATHFGTPLKITLHPTEPFRCDVCGVAFIGKEFLEQHLREHSNHDDNDGPLLTEAQKVKKEADVIKMPKLIKISSAVSTTAITSSAATVSVATLPSTTLLSTTTATQNPTTPAFNPTQLKIVMINDKAYAVMPEGTPYMSGMVKLLVSDPNHPTKKSVYHAIPALQTIGANNTSNQQITMPALQAIGSNSISNQPNAINQFILPNSIHQTANVNQTNNTNKMVMPTIVKIASAAEALNMVSNTGGNPPGGVSQSNPGVNTTTSTSSGIIGRMNFVGGAMNVPSNSTGTNNIEGLVIANSMGGSIVTGLPSNPGIVVPSSMGYSISPNSISIQQANTTSTRLLNIAIPSASINFGGGVVISNTNDNNSAASSNLGIGISASQISNFSAPVNLGSLDVGQLTSCLGMSQLKLITSSNNSLGGIVIATNCTTTAANTNVKSSTSLSTAGSPKVVTSGKLQTDENKFRSMDGVKVVPSMSCVTNVSSDTLNKLPRMAISSAESSQTSDIKIVTTSSTTSGGSKVTSGKLIFPTMTSSGNLGISTQKIGYKTVETPGGTVKILNTTGTRVENVGAKMKMINKNMVTPLGTGNIVKNTTGEKSLIKLKSNTLSETFKQTKIKYTLVGPDSVAPKTGKISIIRKSKSQSTDDDETFDASMPSLDIQPDASSKNLLQKLLTDQNSSTINMNEHSQSGTAISNNTILNTMLSTHSVGAESEKITTQTSGLAVKNQNIQPTEQELNLPTEPPSTIDMNKASTSTTVNISIDPASNSISTEIIESSESVTEIPSSEDGSSENSKPKIFLKPLNLLLENPVEHKEEESTSKQNDDSATETKSPKVRKLYKCAECNAVCKRQIKLQQHQKKYRCKICEFGSCKLKILDVHYSEKHSYKNRCVSCDTQFPTLAELQQHKKTIHLCKQCNRCYFDLNKHQNNYRCTNCEFFACSATDLDAHYKKIHRITTRCAPCNKTFYSNETFQIHKQEMHYCERCCTFKMDLNVHKTFCKGNGQPVVNEVIVEEVIDLDSD